MQGEAERRPVPDDGFGDSSTLEMKPTYGGERDCKGAHK